MYFSLAHLRAPAGAVTAPKGTGEARAKEMARAEHVDQVKGAVLVVGELVDVLQGEQRYLERRLVRHISTCRSSSSRALWYTVLEVVVMSVVGCANVAYVAALFGKHHAPMRPRLTV